MSILDLDILKFLTKMADDDSLKRTHPKYHQIARELICAHDKAMEKKLDYLLEKTKGCEH